MIATQSLRPDRRAGVLLAGVVLLFALAVAGTVALPALDPSMNERSDAARTFSASAERGMAVYRSEGCWYCHSQQVREVRTDGIFGKPLLPGDDALQRPGLAGVDRLASDLTHVGSRYGSREELVKLLKDPRGASKHSQMPSYRYLSARDLDDLAGYLLALK